MRIGILTAALAFVATSSNSSATSVSTDPRQAPTGVYHLEPRHTQIQFAISHFGITDFFGRFDKASGTLNFNAAEPEKSSVAITIDITSLDTQNAALNEELKGADVFDSARSPTATFRSTSASRTGANTGVIGGDLTLKGIARPVTLDVTFNGSSPSPLSTKTTLVGFHATTTIKRRDFDLSKASWSSLVGDEVKLDIEAPFELKKE